MALFGSMFGIIAMGAIFVTLTSAIAAPTALPPDGNPPFPVANVNLACQTSSSSASGATLTCNPGYVVTGMIGCRLPSLESAPAIDLQDNSVTFNDSGACSSPNYIRCCQLN